MQHCGTVTPSLGFSLHSRCAAVIYATNQSKGENADYIHSVPNERNTLLPNPYTILNKERSQPTVQHQPRPEIMACCGGNIVDTSGRTVGTPGPARRYQVIRPRGHVSRNEPRRIQLLGGRMAVTLETLFYFYLGLLLLGVLYKRGWFTSTSGESDFRIG